MASKQIIDHETWERRDILSYFSDFLNTFYSVTVEVEIGTTLESAREKGDSFFLRYLYALLRSANEIKELRYRVVMPGEETLLYDRVDVLTPVKMRNKDMFYTVRIPYIEDFDEFHTRARAIIDAIPDDGDPYGAERDMEDHDVILVSAIPGISLMGFGFTQRHRRGCDFPLISVGKTATRDGRQVMPVAIGVDHCFVDGAHLSEFFRRTELYLQNRGK